MSNNFKGKMAQEISNWQNVGLISPEQAEILHQRYDPKPFQGTILLKWLGLFAVFMLGMSFLGFIGTIMASFSPLFSALCLSIVAGYVLYYGARLAAEKIQKHPFTGQTLLTAGLIGLYASLVAIYYVSTESYSRSMDMSAFFMLITSSAAFLTAYYFHLRWPLLIALLMLFHGIGSMSEYWGHGSYFLTIQDQRMMSVLALITILWGLWHEHQLEPRQLRRCIGFGGLYIIFGLLYLNLSLWMLSLDRDAIDWIIIFTLVCITQIIVGARLKDSRFTGFGIVFLSINIYTRFYEQFWDSLSKALFFSIAGMAAMLLGYLFERQLIPDDQV